MPDLSRRHLMAGAAMTTMMLRRAVAQVPKPTPMTIVVHRDGPAWRHGRPPGEQPLGPHLGYVGALFQNGKVIAYGTQVGPVVRGYYVLLGDDPAVAHDFIAGDPGIRAGVIAPFATHGWSVLINGFRPVRPGESFSILRMDPGPHWVSGRSLVQQDLAAHFASMIEQAKAGIVVAGGPDASGRAGWYVVAGDTSAAARMLETDPGTRSGILMPSIIGWNVIAMHGAAS